MSTVVVATVKSNSSSPPTFQNTSGTEIGRLCRAFVNFNGTGTVAINSQYNVSSITDNGVGDYTVNFTNALADANYCSQGFAWASAKNAAGIILGPPNTTTNPQTASSVRVSTHDNFSESILFDGTIVNVAIFR